MSVYRNNFHARIMVMLISFFMVFGNVAPSLSGTFFVEAATKEVSSWAELRTAIAEAKSGDPGDTIIIKKDIMASPQQGDESKSIKVDGGKKITIKGPDDKEVHIYRDKKDADFSLFEVDGGNLTLGKNLVLSGQTGNCGEDKSGAEFRVILSNGLSGDKEKTKDTGAYPAGRDLIFNLSDSEKSSWCPGSNYKFAGWTWKKWDGTEGSSDNGTTGLTVPEGIHGTLTLVARWEKYTGGTPTPLTSWDSVKQNEPVLFGELDKDGKSTGKFFGIDDTPAYNGTGYWFTYDSDWWGADMRKFTINGPGYKAYYNGELKTTDDEDAARLVVNGKKFYLQSFNTTFTNIKPYCRFKRNSEEGDGYPDEFGWTGSDYIYKFKLENGFLRTSSQGYLVRDGSNTFKTKSTTADGGIGLFSAGDLANSGNEKPTGEYYETGNPSWTPQTFPQTCTDEGGCATYTSTDGNVNVDDSNKNPVIKFSNGTATDPRGFFAYVHDGGSLKNEGAKISDFIADKDMENVAPIVVNGGSFDMSDGSIEHNSVGYTVLNNTTPTSENVNTVENKVKNTWKRTNTAGAVIYTGGATGTLSGGSIKNNRADAGAIIVEGSGSDSTSDKTSYLTLKGNAEIDRNVGVHYAGGIYAYNGGHITMEGNAILKNNFSWSKGGAVFVSDEVYGSTQWGKAGSTDYVAQSGFVMKGGTIDNNMAISRAGAIEVMSNGVYLEKGDITNNTSRALGGAIYVEGDGVDRMYTLIIKKGQISENEAVGYVANDRMTRTFKSATNPSNNPCSFVNDWDESKQSDHTKVYDNGSYNNYYGYGGGIWLCSFGGNATFNATGDWNVIVDNNKAAADTNHKKGNSNEKGGTDIQVHIPKQNSPNGLNVINVGQNKFVSERTGATLQSNTFYPGIQSIKNEGNASVSGGVNIKNNTASNGGGIAANGTVVFGEDTHIYTPMTNLKLTKHWAAGAAKKWPLHMQFVLLDKNGNRVENADMSGFNTTFNGVKDEFSAEPEGYDQYGENDSAWEQIDGDGNSFAEMSIPWVVTVDNKPYPVFTLKFKDDTTRNITYDDAGRKDAFKEFNPANNKDVAALWHGIKNREISSDDLTIKEWRIALVEKENDENGDEIYYKPLTDSSQGLTVKAEEEKSKKVYDKAGHKLATTVIHPISFGFANDVENGATPEEPKVEKYVNNKVHEDLPYFDDVFTYSVMTYVPEDADKITITDTLEKTLEFVDFNGKRQSQSGFNDKLIQNSSTTGYDLVYVTEEQLNEKNLPLHGGDGNGAVSIHDDKDFFMSKRDQHLNTALNNVTLNGSTVRVTIDQNSGIDKVRGNWVILSFRAAYKPNYYNLTEVVKAENGWITEADDKTGQIDYVKTNGELHARGTDKPFVLKLGDKYYLSQTGSGHGKVWTILDDSSGWIKDFGKIPACNTSLIKGVEGIYGVNGYVESDERHKGTANQAGLEIEGGHYSGSEYETNIVTVTPPEVQLEVEKKWDNADGSKAWPNGVNEIEVDVMNGSVVADTIKLTEGKPKNTSKKLPKLKGVTYTLKEKTEIPKYTSLLSGDGTAASPYILTNSEEKPEPKLEKYVNNKVHEDLPYFDDVFEYSIMAFVPKDATEITIKDTLEASLMFVDAKGRPQYKADGTANADFNKKDLTNADQSMLYNKAKDSNGHYGYDIVYVDADDEISHKGDGTGTVAKHSDTSYASKHHINGPLKNGKTLISADGKTLSVTIDGSDINTVRGKWVIVSFRAAYKPTFYDLDEVKKAQNGWLDKDADKSGQTDDSLGAYGINGYVESSEVHEGTANQAEYDIKGGHFGGSSYKTNIVTVTPPTEDVEVEKKWKNADGTDAAWPAAVNSIEVDVKNGNSVVGTITLNKDNPSGKLENLPTLNGVTYTVEEKTGLTGYTTSDPEKGGNGVWTITNSEKPGTPEIEKYVHQAVHKDITIDETFDYDIIAYVTKDADKVVIEDTLKKYFEFTGEDEIKVLDLGPGFSDANNHEVVYNVSGQKQNHSFTETVALKAGDDNNGFTVKDITNEDGVTVDPKKQGFFNAEKLTVTIDPAKDYRDHWIKVSFSARIKDGNTVEKLEKEYLEVKGNIVNTFDKDRTDPKTGNAPVKAGANHEGLANDASYKIEVGGDPKKHEDRSNTVTVKPTQVSTKVEKKWVDANGNTNWPQGKTVEFKVVYGNGVVADQEKTVTLSKSGAVTVGPFDEVTNGSFTVSETGTPEGWTASAASEAGGVWTVTNTEDKGTPKIEKYVNHKVHDDIKYFDQEFEYEVLAYIPKGTKKAVITDTLVKDLEFTNGSDLERKGDAKIVILTESNDSTVEGSVKNAKTKEFGKQPHFDFTSDDNGNARITVTIESGHGIAYVNGNGEWVKLTFKAQIKKDSETYAELLKKLQGQSSTTEWSDKSEDKKGNTPTVDDSNPNWPVKNGDSVHEGIDNQAGLQVSFDNTRTIDLESNIVTVKPEYTKIYAQKAWQGDEPDTWSIDIIIKDADGNQVDSFNLNQANKSGSSKELPLLKADYTVEEQAAAGNAQSFTQISRTGKGTDAEPYVFTNKVNDATPTNVTFKTSKSMKHGIALAAGDYSFELYAEADFDEANGKPKAGAKPLQTKKNAANGDVVFDAIEYGTAGTFTYFVIEKNEGVSGVIYSKDVKKVEVKTTRDGDQIVAKINGTDVSGKTHTLEGGSFENNRKYDVSISKQDLGGKELPGAEIKVTGTGVVASFEEEWTSTDSSHTLKLEPGTYKMVEVVEPEGYQRVETTIEFKVNSDGSVEVLTTSVEPEEAGAVSTGSGVILKDAPLEKPEIEKYVNKLNANDRDETVHTDLSAFDEVYTYDIQAYITNDASYVVVEDQLKSVLEFAKKNGSAATAANKVAASDFTVAVKDGAGKDGKTAPILTSAGQTLSASEYRIDESKLESGLLKLEMGTDSKTAAKLGAKYNGKWLQITFNARIKDEYRSIDAIKNVEEEGVSVWVETDNNDPIDKPDASGADGTEITSHDGIVNDAEYTVRRAGLSVNNESNSRVTDNSNEVTVKPETTELKVQKTWANLEAGSTWPEGVKVTFGIFDANGNEVMGTIDGKDVYSATGSNQATVELSASKTSATVTGLPKLVGVTYKAREIKVNDNDVNYKDGTNAGIVNVQEVADGITSVIPYVVKISEDVQNGTYTATNSRPQIEKYVEKDVHADIEYFDKSFEYDIMAYVPAGSTKVVLSDKLISQLKFDYEDTDAAKSAIGASLQYKASNDHKPNGDVSKAGTSITSGFTVTPNLDANTLTIEIENSNAYLDDKWVQATVKAKIDDSAYDAVVAKLTGDDPDSEDPSLGWANITKNGPVDSNKSHDGLLNKASYKVFVGTNPTSDIESNTVTVTPETTEIEIGKSWVGDKASDRLKLAASAADFAKDYLTVVAVDAKGDETAVNPQPTAESEGAITDSTWTFKWSKLPKLQGVTYKVKESNTTGYQTSGSPAANNETITNTRKENKKSLKVKKVWDGVKASEKYAVEIQLYKTSDGKTEAVAGKKVTLDGTVDDVETTAWEYEWTDLPERDANGNDITYSVDELNKRDGFNVAVVDDNAVSVSNELDNDKIEENDQPVNTGSFSYTITNSKPEIEKYVNETTADLDAAARDETVHTDLEAFNRTFTYDIQAYISKEATYAVVTDQLVSVLEFTGTAPTRVVVKNGAADGAAPRLTDAEGMITLEEGKDYTLDKTEWDKNKLVLMLGSEDATEIIKSSNGEDLTGKWLQITFDAKIKDEYKSISALEEEGAEVWTEIKVNNPIDAPDNNSGEAVTSHEGIVNDSSYTVKVGVDPRNSFEFGDKSNTVTVKPKTTEVKVSKEWLSDGSAHAWPKDATVEVILNAKYTVTGDAVEGVDGQKATLNSNKTSHTFKDLPVIDNVTYSVSEGKVTNGGNYTRGDAVEVKEGEWKITNETYTPEIEKYVNPESAAGTEKDGNVHTDLSFFDEVFVYDIQAWITPDAKYAVITDELNKALQFVKWDGTDGTVDKDDFKVVVKSANGKEAPKLSAAGVAPSDEYTVDARDNKLVLAIGEEDSAETLKDAGKWVQVTFKARIKDEYRSISALMNTNGVWARIDASEIDEAVTRDAPNKQNDPIDDVKINNKEVSDRYGKEADHEGVLNRTSYEINKLSGGVSNAWQYSDKSNTVTVTPKTTDIEVSKEWMLDGKKAEWPDGATVEIKLRSRNGSAGEWTAVTGEIEEGTYKFDPKKGSSKNKDIVFELKADNTSATIKGLPVLKGVEYGVAEGKITNRGLYKIGAVEEIKDNDGNVTGFKLTNKANTPEIPEVEKYINQNVHEFVDLDEVFTYDIIAFVPKDADKITITDELDKQLQFAKDGADVKVYDIGTSNNHMTSEKAKEANADATVSKTEGIADITDKAAISAENGVLEIVIANEIESIDDNTGVITYSKEDLSELREHYIRVEFKAQLADNLDITKLNVVQVPNDNPLDVSDSQKDHEGIENHAKYIVEIGNEAKYEPETNVVTVKPDTKEIKISKQDLGGNELPNAQIKVEGVDVNFSETWISTNEPHTMNLPEGQYTMTEVVAPEGYQQVTTVIIFNVDKDGKVTVDDATEDIDGGGAVEVSKDDERHLILKDAPIPVVKISKQDLDGEELVGARMEVRDSEGNIVDEWTSNGKAREIQLMPGTYTMKEVAAPEGYICVTTEISFVVKENGEIDKDKSTATVDKGGFIEYMEGGNIVLKDAPDLVIEKRVNEKKNIKIRNRNKTFTYFIKGEITYTPEEFFGVIDDVPEVMDIVNKDEIYILINGRRLSDEERDQILFIEGNNMRVEPAKEVFQSWGPFTIEIVFQCRFKEDADLTPYITTGVVNEAYAIVDGVFVDVKGDVNKAKVMPAYEDSREARRVRTARTGDDTTLTLWIMIMAMACAAVAVAAIRRRRNKA